MCLDPWVKTINIKLLAQLLVFIIMTFSLQNKQANFPSFLFIWKFFLRLFFVTVHTLFDEARKNKSENPRKNPSRIWWKKVLINYVIYINCNFSDKQAKLFVLLTWVLPRTVKYIYFLPKQMIRKQPHSAVSHFYDHRTTLLD